VLLIHLRAFFGPLPRPRPKHLFWDGLPWALYEFHAPPQGLLDPVCALVLSAVARVQPQMP
jgi:hypothetical protein